MEKPKTPDTNPWNLNDWERQVDAEAAARQNKIERLRIAEPGIGEYDDEKKPHRFLHFLGWMLLIIVLTGAGGFAGWYFWLRHIQPEKKAAVAPPPPPPAVEVDTPTENYNSLAFQMQFDYPADWKVAVSNSNKLTVTSKPMQLKAYNGKQVNGQVIMTIQHKQPSLPEFSAGDATAIRDSEHLDYAKPSQSQRAATYLSFLNYASSVVDNRNGIDGAYITGDNGYLKDQVIPQADVIKGDVLITITFHGCPDTKCASPGQPLTLSPSAWDDAKFVKPIRSMLQSIVAQ